MRGGRYRRIAPAQMRFIDLIPTRLRIGTWQIHEQFDEIHFAIR
jgi:hypothetical protein